MSTGLAWADTGNDFPPRPEPPRLVNDLAGMMTPTQQDQLEQQLLQFAKTTSTQVTIVTISNLGDYEVAQYATELANRWGVGSKEKDNGVIIFASKEDRKINISPGYGLEGALTDAMCGRIIRNEIVPEFKAGNYYHGFQKAAQAVIDATQGEYTADDVPEKTAPGGLAIVVIIIVLVVILAATMGGGGKGGNGNYMSRRGGDILTGAILGSLLGGGSRGSGGGWGGSSGGGGGFGGFGGGSFGGGGASGSW